MGPLRSFRRCSRLRFLPSEPVGISIFHIYMYCTICRHLPPSDSPPDPASTSRPLHLVLVVFIEHGEHLAPVRPSLPNLDFLSIEGSTQAHAEYPDVQGDDDRNEDGGVLEEGREVFLTRVSMVSSTLIRQCTCNTSVNCSTTILTIPQV